MGGIRRKNRRGKGGGTQGREPLRAMSAVVAPSNFLRLKYRPKPLHPELDENEAVYDTSHSIAKKVKPVLGDELAELRALRFRPAVMFPGHTQNKRVEKSIMSDDETYRKETKPTLFERVELQKMYVKKQIREEEAELRRMEQREKVRQKLALVVAEAMGGGGQDGDLEEARRHAEEEARGEDGDGDEEGKQEKEASKKEMNAAGMSAEEMALSSISEADMEVMDPEDVAELKATLLDLKEKRLLRSRQPWTYHIPVTTYRRRSLALKLYLNVGERAKEMTEVLPWLLMGRVELSRNMYGLAKLGVTHILNATDDEPNNFPMQFVYLKLPVRDDTYANIGELFPQAIEFFQRVESKKGKIYVHCTAGISRAPSMVLAYLVAERKIALRDAHDYLLSIRPIIAINDHFLFQLAELELEQGEGSSVTHTKTWMFYEFNRIRSDIDKIRPHVGLLKTTLALWRKREDGDIF